MSTKKIRTEIIIQASPQRVYEVLCDLPSYARWNPFIISSEGKVEKGKRIVNRMKNGEKIYRFKPTITAAEPGKQMAWIGRFMIPGIFDGEHYFQIEDLGNGQVNLIHGENFSGILSSYLLKKIGDSTRANFVAMNNALKNECENEKL